MPGHTDDRERMRNQEGWESSPAYSEGLSRIEAALIRQTQLISLKSNEQGIGNSVGLPAGSMVQLLPYDRNRVRATIFNPPTGPTPAAAPGSATLVTAFGSVIVGAVLSATSNNTNGITVKNDTDVTVTLGPNSATPLYTLPSGATQIFPSNYINSVIVVSVSAAATLGQITTFRTLSIPAAAPTPVTVNVGQKSDIAGGGGYQLQPGMQLVIESIDDVYAMASGQVFVSRFIERQSGDVL